MEGLSKLGAEVTYLSNSYDHYKFSTVKVSFWKLWTEDKYNHKYKGKYIRLKTPSYKGKKGRLLNMLINAALVLLYGIYSFLKREKFDVIIGPSVPTFTSFSGILISKILKVPFCFELRDIWPDALVEIGLIKKNTFIFAIMKRMELFILNNLDSVFSTLPYAKRYVDNYISKFSFYYLPNGVDFESHEHSINNIAVSFPSGLSSFCYVGGFGADHDIKTMIKAAIILEEKGYQFIFDLYGEGLKYDELKKFLSDKYKFIRLFPAVKRQETISLIAQYDFAIAAITNSKSYRHGINLNKLTSYMFSAKPIVFASSAPNNPIIEAGSGFTCLAEDPENLSKNIIKMFNTSKLQREKFGNSGYSYLINNLSMKSLSKKMYQALIEVIKNH
ncbi:glycosyl transferase [Prochlorococcus marinus str. GP2]|uniref:Glycosyl transferase n=1 Tax=Prochlorococcus marinus str. GP2 TaxID=59925 RepID=A0A0A1ZA74_PROMR|nr:glycosyl transferase [Prochlorococcus marinus str. GP2]